MPLKQENELWVQVRYGDNWEDFEECIDMEHVNFVLKSLHESKKRDRVRVIKRSLIENLIEENDYVSN